MRGVTGEWPTLTANRKPLDNYFFFKTLVNRTALQRSTAATAKDNTGFLCGQPKTEIWGFSGNKLNLTGQLKMKKNKKGSSGWGIFLLRHVDGSLRIWHEQYKSMDPANLVSIVEVGMFSLHTLDHPVIRCYRLTLLLTMLWPAVLVTSTVKMHQMQSKSQFNEHNNAFSVLQELLHSPDLNPIAHLWDVQEQEIHCMNMQPTNFQERFRCSRVTVSLEYMPWRDVWELKKALPSI